MPVILQIILVFCGICAPSLVIVLMIRRWIARVSWAAAGGFLVLTLAFLGGAVFTSRLPVPVDEVARGYPHRGVVGPVEARNPLTNDTARLFLPWMSAVREELAAGHMPLWNRYAFSGYPLLGNGESAPFYPIFLATLFVPLPKQIVAMAGVKLFCALLFTYLLLRREKLSPALSAMGASIFAFSVFQTVYLYYSTTAVTSLLPAAVFSMLHLFENPRRRSAFWFFAIVVAVLQTAGHPESVLHVAVACLAMLLIEIAAPVIARNAADSLRRRILTTVAAALFGMLLSAPAWVPVLEQVTRSIRFQEVNTVRQMTPPFPIGAAWTLLSPDIYGNPARQTWNWVLNYSVTASSYFGLLPLALLPAALFSRRANRRDRLLGIAVVMTFLLAMNWTAIGHALNAIPPLSIIANDKIRFFTTFLAAIIAARAVRRIEEGATWIEIAASVLIAAVAAEGLHRKLGLSVEAYAFTGIAGLILFWIIVVFARRVGRTDRIAVAAAVIVTVELFVLNVPFNALVPQRLYKLELPIIHAIHALSPGEPFRIAGAGWVLMPQTPALYGVEDIRGSDPMASASYMKFFELIEAEDDSFGVKRVDDLAQPGLDFLNVRFALTEPGYSVPEGWRKVYEGPDGMLLQNERMLRRFYAPQSLIPAEPDLLAQLTRIDDFRRVVAVDGVRPGPNPQPDGLAITQPRAGKFRLRVSTKETTFLASSQPLSSGWQVSIDGKSTVIHEVNGAFIGFFVPPWQHEVELKYRPLSFTVSGIAAVASLLIGLIVSRRRSGTSKYVAGDSDLPFSQC